MSSSCSFRITRTAEDLAQTLTAISQRLVQLEQRMEALEQSASKSEGTQTDEELVMLDGVDQMIQECKGLLKTSTTQDQDDGFWVDDEQPNQEIAA